VKLSPFAKGLVLVLALILVAGSFIFVNRILAGDVFNQEEAQHGLFGLWIWRDIVSLDWSAFWYDTSRQMVWPFLHSWFLGLFFLVFGVGYTSARLLSLIIFILTILLTYVLANRFCKESGWKIGSLTAVLMLSSPLMLQFAAQNMIEGLGALLFLAATYMYLVCEERKLVIYYVFLAVVLGLSIYTNYIYAFMMLPAFMVMTLTKLGPLGLEAMQLKRKGEKAAVSFIWWAYKKLIVLGVLLILAGAWFSFNFSRRFMLLLDVILKSHSVRDPSWLEGVTYYPRIIVSDLSFSPWLGLLCLIALFIPQVARRFSGSKKLYTFVWTILLMATLIIPAKTPQMIYIVVPFIFMIFSAAVFYFIERLASRDKKQVVLLVLVLLLPALMSVPRVMSLYAPIQPGQNLISVLDFYQHNLPESAKIAAGFNLKSVNNDVIKFHLRDWDDRVIDQDLLRTQAIKAPEVHSLTLLIDETSPYYEQIVDDSLIRWNSHLKQQENAGEIELTAYERFDDIGVTAKIYKQTASGW